MTVRQDIHANLQKNEHYEVTWDEVNKAVENIGLEMRRQSFIPDKILYISRGGQSPATKLSNYFEEHINTRIWSYKIAFNAQKNKAYMPYWWPRLQRDKRYLILDDIYETGITYRTVKKECPEWSNIRFAFLFMRDFDKLSLYDKQEMFIGYKLPMNDNRWLDFPWEIKNEVS